MPIVQLEQPISKVITTNPLDSAGTSKDAKDVAHGDTQQVNFCLNVLWKKVLWERVDELLAFC
jgi:hypothetical protein